MWRPIDGEHGEPHPGLVRTLLAVGAQGLALWFKSKHAHDSRGSAQTMCSFASREGVTHGMAALFPFVWVRQLADEHEGSRVICDVDSVGFSMSLLSCMRRTAAQSTSNLRARCTNVNGRGLF